jgi:hypothetical protein
MHWEIHDFRKYKDETSKFSLRNIPSHGRLWLEGKLGDLHLEWAVPNLWPCAALNLGGERPLHVTLGVPGAKLYMGLYTPVLQKLLGRFQAWEADREVRVDCHDGKIWWNFWTPAQSWSSTTPKWRNGAFGPLDDLFGDERVQSRQSIYSEEGVEIPMPEGVYPAKVCIERISVGRKHLPFREYRFLATINPFKPVPVPGKGENSWDCDEDAVYEMTCPIERNDVTLAIAAFVQSVLNSRRRYGGTRWRPGKRRAS